MTSDKKNVILNPGNEDYEYNVDRISAESSFLSTALRTATCLEYDYATKVGQAKLDKDVITFDNITNAGITIGDTIVIGRTTNNQQFVSLGVIHEQGQQNSDYLYAHDDTDQVGGTAKAMSFNTIDGSDGVGLENNTKITFSQAGVYDIQFSAQLYDTGGTSHDIFIWLKRSGSNEPATSTRLQMANNLDYLVAAWNWFIEIDNTEDYIEIWWYVNSLNVSLEQIPAQAGPPAIPATPSIILTVNRVS